jgi:uncharacterized repeat protein (TIGR03803 family)
LAESRAKRFSQTKPVKVSSGQLTNGTTGNGGTFGFGTVFELAPDETETILHSFGGPPSDGSYGGGPTLLRDSSGNLYGSTYYGGAYDGNEQGSGYGTVFKVSASGVESVLLNFNGHGGGGYPLDGLAGGGSGNFYGTTGSGGSASCSEYPTGCGVLFRLNSNGRETVLHKFGESSADGRFPYAGVIQDSSGNLYGTTYYGGTDACGTVFKYTP